MIAEFTPRDLLFVFRVGGAGPRAKIQAGVSAVIDELPLIDGKKQLPLRDIYRMRMVVDKAAE